MRGNLEIEDREAAGVYKKAPSALACQDAQTSTLKPGITDASEGSRDAAPAPSFLLHSIHSIYSHAMPQILTVLEEFLDGCSGSCHKSLYLSATPLCFSGYVSGFKLSTFDLLSVTPSYLHYFHHYHSLS